MTPDPGAGRISVALCTCNGSAFIAEQIESICRQTVPADELVLHDDASDDDTVERARVTWQRLRDAGVPVPELRVTRHAHRRGVAANFSGALADCRGPLVALCDQDDRWHPDRLEVAATLMRSNPRPLLLHADARLVDGMGQPLGQGLFEALAVTGSELQALEQGRALEVLLDRNLVTGAATMVRRELLELAMPVPPHWIHDEWLGVVAAALGRLAVIRQPLLDYRQHGRNQIGARQESWAAALRRLARPRGPFLQRRLARAQELQSRLQALGDRVPPAVLTAVSEKVEHHAVRARLPAHRLLRLLPVWREWRTGRYRRFGRGIRGLAKDLLEGP